MYPYIHIMGKDLGTYGLCMLLGFALAGFCAYHKGKSQGFRWEDLLIIAAMALGCALVCGSTLYAFVTYSPDEIITFIRQGAFQFLGGIVFYGGLIGGVIGALAGIKIAGCSLHQVEHSVVPFIPLGHAIGRIGCVMSGCCYGFPYEGPFALYYPHSLAGVPADQGFFPVQPLESAINLVICLLLLGLEKRIRRTWDLLCAYLCLYAISRFFLEMLRGDAIRGVLHGLSTSQYVSIGMLLICFVRLVIFHRSPRSHSQTQKKS